MFKTVSRLARLGRAAALLLPHLGAFKGTRIVGATAGASLGRRIAGGPREEASGRPPRAGLADALTRLGPSYVKLGQFLATRPDLVGAGMALELASLRDRLPPAPRAKAIAILEAEFGAPLGELYASFGESLAAASIAQVHRAEIAAADGTRAVAVKILRPGIEAKFAAELDAFETLARFLEWVRPAWRRLEPVKVVETLRASVAAEMDLRIEAAAASELAETMREDPAFRIPRIDWTRTSRRVLTSEWIDGTRLADRDGLIAAGADPAGLARALMQGFLRQALMHGFFHADLHQGNLFVDAAGRLVAVDFGIMGRLDKATRRWTAEILHGFLMRDYLRIARIHFEAGYVPAHHSLEDFALALRAVGEPIWGRPSADISMASLLEQLFEVTRRFDMHLQPQLIFLQKTMVVVEGVARELDPGHNIWESARPVLEAWMAAEMGPEARLREVADNALSLGRVLQEVPALVRAAEHAADALAGEGLRLHPETARAIGREEAKGWRGATLALWGVAGALLLVAALLAR